MIYGIIQWCIISLILIILVHHIFFFLKDTLTVPKVKDLVHQPFKSYKEIEETLACKPVINTNDNISSTEIDKTEMKNELKQFFNELKHKPESDTLSSNFTNPWSSTTLLSEIPNKI